MKDILKTMNSSIKKWVMVMLVTILASCSRSLDDININPNSLPDKETDIQYVLTGILTTSAQITVDLIYKQGELSSATQYLQRDFTSYAHNTYEWGSIPFAKYYEPIKDSEYIYGRAEEEKTGDERSFYQAAALIMKSYWYGFMTSAYGDIPYSKAMQAEKGGDEFFKPVYDAQEDIFAGLIADLDRANNLLKDVGIVQTAAQADVLFKGDGQRWRKFANSLRLRYYMRLSEKSSSKINARADFAAMIANSSEHPLMNTIQDNAAVQFIGTDAINSWPGGPINYRLRSEFYRRKPSATIVSTLVALQDPRLTKWIRPVDVQIKQGAASDVVLEQGIVTRYTDINIVDRNNDSNLENDINTALFVGLGVALTSPNDYNMGNTVSTLRDKIQSANNSIYLGEASNPHLSYLSEIYTQDAHPLNPALFMSSAEVYLILAEAAQRGWIGGDAWSYFETGVLRSLEQYAIADGDNAAVYDVQGNRLVPFDRAAFVTNIKQEYQQAANKLKPIMTQKWIALWMTGESWFDWRRTGFPDLNEQVVSGSNSKNVPLRFWYEDAFNEKEMLSAVEKLSPKVNNHWSKMWLLQ
ncbi:SusD/RagB family nutrient-binding outer membrane lipoprotein [Sphingobacterium alkalisoli]|uniref:SusD/RagB family nutrient-binding outer membrane lipoprotein n=1 Tax=Sphingobacterium alkalisoli TaxID=1874115 RepID=A0A4V5LXI4_9SPHI|nr:SusD/RagB family nutrient-binding outer membrane lipoprotein [Sphingobacterium alkalisoli]TJY61449.1 SusD/RagB family nutrient-binding outer membrane lipoprotein [Sphingobacterium alkalisoli]GGH30327.1 hypothetical protein GCM10011418_42280 [Sphingobacterium alkalisoli]